jgi:hypothetical protein
MLNSMPASGTQLTWTICFGRADRLCSYKNSLCRLAPGSCIQGITVERIQSAMKWHARLKTLPNLYEHPGAPTVLPTPQMHAPRAQAPDIAAPQAPQARPMHPNAIASLADDLRVAGLFQNIPDVPFADASTHAAPPPLSAASSWQLCCQLDAANSETLELGRQTWENEQFPGRQDQASFSQQDSNASRQTAVEEAPWIQRDACFEDDSNPQGTSDASNTSALATSAGTAAFLAVGVHRTGTGWQREMARVAWLLRSTVTQVARGEVTVTATVDISKGQLPGPKFLTCSCVYALQVCKLCLHVHLHFQPLWVTAPYFRPVLRPAPL